MAKIYEFKALTSKGKELDFAQFEGKVLLMPVLPYMLAFAAGARCRNGVSLSYSAESQ